MKKYLSYLAVPFVGLYALTAFASGEVQPDLTLTLLSLLEAIKGNGGVAVILVAVFQLLRTAPVLGILGKFSGKYLQLIIAAATALGYVAKAAAEGKSWGMAAVEGLFTAGGAMLIYTAIREIKSK